MRSQVVRWRDEVVARTAPWADRRGAALVGRAGIKYEQLVRALWAAPPALVRRVWGLVGTAELDRLAERVSLLDDRIRRLEEGER